MRAFIITTAKSFAWISASDQSHDSMVLYVRLGTRLITILFTLSLLPCLVSGKRGAPPKVEPLIYEGVRYVAPNDDGRRAYIEAWDVKTKKKLWELTIFTNRIDPALEEDVQWVFIDKLSVRDGMLILTSERGNTYQIV